MRSIWSNTETGAGAAHTGAGSRMAAIAVNAKKLPGRNRVLNCWSNGGLAQSNCNTCTR